MRTRSRKFPDEVTSVARKNETPPKKLTARACSSLTHGRNMIYVAMRDENKNRDVCLENNRLVEWYPAHALRNRWTFLKPITHIPCFSKPRLIEPTATSYATVKYQRYKPTYTASINARRNERRCTRWFRILSRVSKLQKIRCLIKR